MKKEKVTTRETGREILKRGVLDMNVERLKQMSRYGLMGHVSLTSELVSVINEFNRIKYDEELGIISFLIEKSQESSYAEINFLIESITEITGSQDEQYPEKYLDISINLENGTDIEIVFLY